MTPAKLVASIHFITARSLSTLPILSDSSCLNAAILSDSSCLTSPSSCLTLTISEMDPNY